MGALTPSPAQPKPTKTKPRPRPDPFKFIILIPMPIGAHSDKADNYFHKICNHYPGMLTFILLKRNNNTHLCVAVELDISNTLQSTLSYWIRLRIRHDLKILLPYYLP